MAVPAVQRFGSGYIQGAEQAAKEMKLTDAELQYYYAGAFQKTDDATAKAKGWYAAGTEVVFACGGKVYQSVQEACENNTSRKWIGVDVDQHSVDPDRVITSAFTGLRNSVQSALEIYSANTWEDIGGKVFNLGLNAKLGKVEAKDYVGLPTADASWGFKTFTKANYEELLNNMMEEIEGMPKKAPDLMIYLSGSFETFVNRIKKRGRDYEIDDSLLDYYYKLWIGYDEWINNHYKASEVLVIDIDSIDYVNNKEDRKIILKEIENKLAKIRGRNNS